MTSRARLPVVLLAAATLLAVSLFPEPAAAQRRAVPRTTRPGVTRPIVVRPIVVRPIVARPLFSRPLFWGPYGWAFGSSIYWGYGGYGFYQRPFGYPFYGPRYLASSIRIQVTPKTAEVFVDGYYAGIVDDFDGTFQRLNIEPGQHEIVVWAEGYRTIRQRLHLEPGRSYKIAETMVQLPPGEEAEPRPEPPLEGQRGAPFYGAGEDRPYPPTRPGRERVPDRPERERPGAETRAAPESGELVMRIQPAGATVFIDGEEWKGPEDARLTVRLATGEHKVVVSAEGYQAFETTVWITAGESVTLNVSLLKN